MYWFGFISWNNTSSEGAIVFPLDKVCSAEKMNVEATKRNYNFESKEKGSHLFLM
jgi:hypothetical protein